MSFHFNVSGKSKEEAIANARAEMDKVVDVQDMHKSDRDAVLNAVAAYVNILPGDAGAFVMVSGSVGWEGQVEGENDNRRVRNAAVNISVTRIDPGPA